MKKVILALGLGLMMAAPSFAQDKASAKPSCCQGKSAASCAKDAKKSCTAEQMKACHGGSDAKGTATTTTGKAATTKNVR